MVSQEELLARISLAMPKDNSNVYIEDVIAALRAVVELHKEVTLVTGQSTDGAYTLKQQVCLNCTDLAGKPIPYPCFNIQAIEKELS